MIPTSAETVNCVNTAVLLFNIYIFFQVHFYSFQTSLFATM